MEGSMKLLKLDNESLILLRHVPEAGMDFWVVVATQDVLSGNEPFVVRSDGTVAPFKNSEEYYSVESIDEGIVKPEQCKFVSFASINPLLTVPTVDLPSGYTPTLGAHQLLGTITLNYPEKFYRYTSSTKDGRYTNGTLERETYLTTVSDQEFVNTGFGVVGRYSLPLPVPSSNEHIYTIPKGTSLKVGTVSPKYGQSGGGVEVQTISAISGVKHEATKQIADY